MMSNISWIQWNCFWDFFVGPVVQWNVNTIVRMFSLGFVSGFHSLLGFLNLSLSDVNVSVVDPH